MTAHPCDRFLDELRKDSPDPREQGRRFEDFCRLIYFKEDSRYASRYEWVKTYADYAKEKGDVRR